MNTPLNVFFLEDNDDLAFRFIGLLKQQGHTVHRATSVEDAIDQAIKLPKIDVFVVDIMVPDTHAQFKIVSMFVKERDDLAALWGRNNTTQSVPYQQTIGQQRILEDMERLNQQIMQNVNRQGGIEFLIRLKVKNQIGDARIAIFSSSNPDDPYENAEASHPHPHTFQSFLSTVQNDESQCRWFQKPVSLRSVAKWISACDA
jgi:CheY-like chemotaxis protein